MIGKVIGREAGQQGPGLYVSDVERLCRDGAMSYAVVIAVDRAAGTTQFLTWGETAEDKLDARAMREHFEQAGGYDAEAVVHEDFVRDAAEVKRQAEHLAGLCLRSLRALRNAIEVGYLPRPELGSTEQKLIDELAAAIRGDYPKPLRQPQGTTPHLLRCVCGQDVAAPSGGERVRSLTACPMGKGS